MLLAIKWAREQKKPFLGICLGFQLSVIEWARNVLEIEGKLLTPTYVTVLSNNAVFPRRHFGRI